MKQIIKQTSKLLYWLRVVYIGQIDKDDVVKSKNGAKPN